MKSKVLLNAMLTATTLSAVIIGGMLLAPSHSQAFDKPENPGNGTAENQSDESKIQRGFEIAPVQLNLTGKNRALVGLGSYLVNAAGGCNDCHSQSPETQYVPGGIPYFGQHPTKVNPATYLGGGRNFGALIPGSAEIISRNLTPDKTGLPAGGMTFDQFVQVMRTGADLDHLHPTCTGAPNSDCIPAPFDGSLLQIMPWPIYQNMTDHDLRAIYEYLSSVPCIAGPPTGELHHDCQ
jgi:hypothetical protein